jgi:hypothetical protein
MQLKINGKSEEFPEAASSISSHPKKSNPRWWPLKSTTVWWNANNLA